MRARRCDAALSADMALTSLSEIESIERSATAWDEGLTAVESPATAGRKMAYPLV